MTIEWVDDPREDGQWAADTLRRWLEAGGFGPLQPEGDSRADGYFISKAKVARHRQARVHYRGGGLATVQRKLEAVAERLDQLGVDYEVEQRNVEWAVYFPLLVVEVDERLWRKSNADASPVSDPPA